MKWLRLIVLLSVFTILLVVILTKETFRKTNLPAASVSYLRCEYLINPMGIDAVNPRLSWIITSSRRGEQQMAYQILVASSPELLSANNGDLWDTGKMQSDETCQIAYNGGRPLASRERCYWKVRIWDQDGASGWSPVASWEMGLLKAADWKADWISVAPPPLDPAARLLIRRAIYQATDDAGAADVTALVESRMTNNSISMKVGNDTFGRDPAPNHRKKLVVDYEWKGQSKALEVSEDGELAIPAKNTTLPYLRKSFDLARPVQRAVLYATALGLYQIDINGHRVGDHIFAPDWTDYRKRVRYQVYDVTKLVQQGSNAMAALLANGWYSGHIGNGGYQLFGKVPALLAQLEVTYADGSTEVIASDASWKSYPSPILASDIMLGETYDSRKEIEGWNEPRLDESQWTQVEVCHEPSIALGAQLMEPVRELRELKPKKETEPKPGLWTYDLGQNMVGVVRLAISAPAGTEVMLRHAEMLKPDGTVYTNNLRGAPSVDRYICKGTGTEIWQPRFTFHGFRYVEVSGLPMDPGTNAVTGIVIGTATPQTGQFACSDPRVSQLESNIQWGQRGNYLSVPTDCPQRDERMGWMGDAEVFVGTAIYNADVAAFFTKWLVDVDDGQANNGAFSDVSPNDSLGHTGAPGWGDAGVICPWTIYQAYGDTRILEQQLPAMIQWVEFMRRNSHDLIRDGDRGNDYGDWLSINADTPKELLGTAYFARSAHLVAESCSAVGRTNDADRYEQLFQNIKAAFDKKYVSADGHVEGHTQTAYALALNFDLLPDNLRTNAAQYLAEDVRKKGWHLSTGFLGVGKLLPMLAENGQSDTAYRVLLQDTYPSWLFPVEHGATTIWERWDGWTPDKGFEDPEMNSFNHYSLGSCGEFLMRYIGGIRPASPGYKTILIDPVIGNGLTWAKTSYYSIHGPIVAYWKLDGDQLELRVTIPANSTATVVIPMAKLKFVTESGKPIEKAEGVKFMRQEKDKVYLEAGSGTYNFISEKMDRPPATVPADFQYPPLPESGSASNASPAPFVVTTVDGKTTIAIDTSAAPELSDWASHKLAPVLAEWYPKIVALLPSDGFTAPRGYTITVRDMDGVAYTTGTNVFVSSSWCHDQMNGQAVASLVHESVHVVQQYHSQGVPSWLVEGMADYIRWFKYEPQSHGADIIWMRHRGKDFSFNYDGSYRISANFLDWVTGKYDSNIVTEVNAVARDGKYTDDYWKQQTGKTLQELGAEWKSDIEAQLQPGGAGN